MGIQDLIQALGEEILDPSEETFLLFSQPISSQNLGFVDAKATSIEITVSGKDLIVAQSPGLLSSIRNAGTTGAVVWKITPLIAEWISSVSNILFTTGILNGASNVLELGCGVSGILPVMVAPKVGNYIATDQEYVFKLLKQNVTANNQSPNVTTKKKSHGKASSNQESGTMINNIKIIALDWETTCVSNLMSLLNPASSQTGCIAVSVILACDCIYNEYLIQPFVRTCTEICRLAPPDEPTLCVVAQQLRSDSVFEAWLGAFCEDFHAWKVSDELLTKGLRDGTGFVIHMGILREVKG